MAKDKTYGSPYDYAIEGARVRKRGAGVDYTPNELRQLAVDYFETMRGKVWNRVEAVKGGPWAGTLYDVPTSCPLNLKGFLIFAGFGSRRWSKYRENEAYADVVEWIESIVEVQNVEGAMVGAYNANLVARVHKIADKTETDATVRIDNIQGMKITP